MTQSRLDSWKSVAEYLGRGERTVQRWHAEYGLPAHHVGGKKGTVFAYSDELDLWLRARGHPPAEGPTETETMPRDGTHCSTALTATAKGLWEILSERNLQTVAHLYRTAIDDNPHSSEGFAGLANSLIISTMVGALPVSAAASHVDAALTKAVSLGPRLIETRRASAWLELLLRHKFLEAQEDFTAILVEQPRDSVSLMGAALVCVAQERLEAASDFLTTACEATPLNSIAVVLLCWNKYLLRDFESSKALCSQARAAGISGALIHSIEILLALESEITAALIERAKNLIQTHPHPILQGALGYMYGILGETEKAQEIGNELMRRGQRGEADTCYAIALVMMGISRQDQALAWMERSSAEGSLWSLGLLSDPVFSSLRRDQKLQILHRTIDSSRLETVVPTL